MQNVTNPAAALRFVAKRMLYVQIAPNV